MINQIKLILIRRFKQVVKQLRKGTFSAAIFASYHGDAVKYYFGFFNSPKVFNIYNKLMIFHGSTNSTSKYTDINNMFMLYLKHQL